MPISLTYAEAFVKRMREETAKRGFSNAQMYLSIFYGWDNSFKIPSYASAGADGYFMNNYTYPKNDNAIPDETASDADLINRARLSISVSKFLKDYPDKPLVVEFGFHTLEYNGGKKPNQTAGLVANRAAKARAIKATLDYYQQAVPNFRGALYFGYNLYKEEGNPPAVMDWTLTYPDGDGWATTTNPPAPTDGPDDGEPTNGQTTGGDGTTAPSDSSTPATDPGQPGDESDGPSSSETNVVASTDVASDPDESSETRQASGMPLATKIALGVLGGLVAVLGGLTAFWLVLRHKAKATG